VQYWCKCEVCRRIASHAQSTKLGSASTMWWFTSNNNRVNLAEQESLLLVSRFGLLSVVCSHFPKRSEAKHV